MENFDGRSGIKLLQQCTGSSTSSTNDAEIFVSASSNSPEKIISII